MATGVGRGEILMTPLDRPGPKIEGQVQTVRNYLSRDRVIPLWNLHWL